MFLLIDNYDSFTWNLYHYFLELGAEMEVVRNDEITVDAIREMAPEGIVLSPGPCTPNEAGICLEVIEKLGSEIPILGVCLGHQSIGQAFGGKVMRAPKVMHGKTSRISHDRSALFGGLPDSFDVTRYHSLIVERESMPDCLKITSESDDGLVMAIEHSELPIFGVQFHPESIASEHGHAMLDNFLKTCRKAA